MTGSTRLIASTNQNSINCIEAQLKSVDAFTMKSTSESDNKYKSHTRIKGTDGKDIVHTSARIARNTPSNHNSSIRVSMPVKKEFEVVGEKYPKKEFEAVGNKYAKKEFEVIGDKYSVTKGDIVFVNKAAGTRLHHHLDFDDDDAIMLDTSDSSQEHCSPTSSSASPSASKSLDQYDDLTRGQRLSRRWSKFIIQTFHKPILRGLQSVSGVSARNPIKMIIFIILLSLALFAGGWFTNFRLESDEDRQWTPSNSEATKHNNWIFQESSFPLEYRTVALFFHSQGSNVLGKKQMRMVFNVTDTIFNKPEYNDICQDGDVNIKLPNGTAITTCYIIGAMRFWNFSSLLYEWSVFDDDQFIKGISQMNYPDGVPIEENMIFGNPVRDNKTGLLQSLTGYIVVFALPRTDKAAANELDFVHTVLDINDAWQNDPETAGFYVDAVAEGTFAEEFERAIVKDTALVPLVIVVMTTFSCLYFFRWSKVQSRCLMGLAAVYSVVLAIMAGYGILFMIGVPFTSMTQLIPFIIIGVGLDDAFIIVDTYERTDPSKDPVDRMYDSMQECGFSITLTTLTSAIAFGIGCFTSSVPAVYWLCFYASPTVVLVLIWQLTFFVGCMMLDERRIQSRRRDCCICVKMNDFQTYAKDVYEYNKTVTEHSDFSSRAMEWFAEHLLRPRVQYFVIFSFVTFSALCAWSTSKFEQEFSFRDVLPSDSYMPDFVDSYETYATSLVSPKVYFRNEDFSGEYVQEQMEKFVNDLAASKDVKGQPAFFWLRDFKKFTNSSDAVSSLSFNDQLKAFLEDPIYYELYQRDMAFAPDGTLIETRTKIDLNIKIGGSIKDQLRWLNEQSNASHAQEINEGKYDMSFFTYHDMYNQWSFYAVCVSQLVQSTIVGIVSVSLLVFLLIPHWSAVIFVCPIVCMMYVDILGILQWAGIKISPVSYVAVVMSIGLIIDYIMHVLLRFYETPGVDRRERTVETLCTMGSSIVAGGLSTFLGTMPLVFSTSDIFFTVFVAFVTLVTVAIAHGLIFLPVLLAMFGPEVEKVILKENILHMLSSKGSSNTFEQGSIDGDCRPERRYSL